MDGFEEGKQIDVNAANQELQGIMDVSNSITSPEYNSTKSSLNTAIGRIRTFLGDQTMIIIMIWLNPIIASLAV